MNAATPVERTHLFVPATSWRMIEKAAKSKADAVVIDLEDAVAPSDKEAARANVVRALSELDFGGALRIYRINALDTHWAYRDVIDIFEAAGEKVDRIMLPKAGRGEDVYFLDTLITQLSSYRGVERQVGIEAQIETALGVLNARTIAAASSRLTALIFGSGDFAASAGMPQTSIGEMDTYDATYPGHRWHHAMQSVVLAARAHGLQALDGPFAGLEDDEGLAAAARVARGLGFDGKQCIHPKQLEVVSRAFSPTPEEVAWAEEVMAALEQAAVAGQGAIRVRGRMLDAANIRMARGIIEKVGQIRRREGE